MVVSPSLHRRLPGLASEAAGERLFPQQPLLAIQLVPVHAQISRHFRDGFVTFGQQPHGIDLELPVELPTRFL